MGAQWVLPLWPTCLTHRLEHPLKVPPSCRGAIPLLSRLLQIIPEDRLQGPRASTACNSVPIPGGTQCRACPPGLKHGGPAGGPHGDHCMSVG